MKPTADTRSDPLSPVSLIGLDIGERRIGVAATDPLGTTAQPLETIERDEKAIEKLAELARERDAGQLVVGLPLGMDGRPGEQATRVREYADEIASRLGLPVAYVDERLTTKEAESVLSRVRAPRSRRKEASDMLAAAIILRTYMDGLREK